MKIRNSLKVLSSLAVLSTAQMAVADGLDVVPEAAEPQIAECWDCNEPIIIICPGPVELPTIDPVLIDENGLGFTTITGEPLVEEPNLVEEEVQTQEETNTEEVLTDGEVVEAEDGGGQVDPEVLGDGDGFVVPDEWIKRGDGENPDMYYYSAVNTPDLGAEPTTVTKSQETSPLSRQTGPDHKTTTIVRRENAVIQANSEQEGPVAIVKKGRIFLR